MDGHRPPRIYLIAGEASGDLHGANLVRELLRIDPGIQVRAWGGDRLAGAGADVVKHYRDLAFMGFTQVVMNLRTILRNMRWCREDIRAYAPDLLVLVDYPGFNLRIADWAHAQGIRVVYYISPQLWAWKPGRIDTVKRAVERMITILPFEQAWYAARGVQVDHVGHPLLDALPAEAGAPRATAASSPIALLPGSRRQEIERVLPVMLAAARRHPHERFVIAAAPAVPRELYARIIGDAPVELRSGGAHGLLAEAKAALVTSGTATLETALFGVPEVVCYSGGPINVWLARRLIRVPFISLVNLIMEREVVPELIQQDLNADRLSTELDRLLNDSEHRARMLADLAELRRKLGGPGASARAAALVWKSLDGGTKAA
jgi:lipid-A-disaccharide synthase